MKRMLAAALAATLLLLTPARADDGPVDAVRQFYLHQDENDRDPARFTGPALATIEKNAAYEEKTGEVGCLDFAFAFDAQDWDDGEVARSLKLTLESEQGDAATVAAEFTVFTRATKVVWTLQQVDGAWLVSDISYSDGQWTLGGMCDDL